MNFQMKYFLDALQGGITCLPVTLKMSVSILLVGLFVGTIMALCRVFKVKVLAKICSVFIAISKALPTNLIIIVMNLVITNYFNSWMSALHIDLQIKDVDKIFIAVIALSVSSIASISENVRGALLSVPVCQYEAGYSVGLTGFQTFISIIVPQAMLTLFPALINSFIMLIKMTSLAMLVGVSDVLNGMIIRASKTFGYLEAYVAAAVVYWVISVILEFLGRVSERKLGKYKNTSL